METKNASDISRTISESAAGAVRLVTLRLTGQQKTQIRESRHFDRHVRSFLDAEVKFPFKYKQVSPTAFALNGKCKPDMFDRYTISIHDRLIEFLFGSEGVIDADVIVFAGSEKDVAEFITEPEEKAIERSRRYLQGVLDKLEKEQAEKENPAAPNTIKRYSGKRPLLYRGILACPHKVLIAYAITPNANPEAPAFETRPQDIDLARYMSFRGTEAIDFSMRIFDKASYLLQTGSKEMQSVILLVPLSYRTLLSNRDRESFLKNAEDHPEWVRKQMFISVFGSPPQPSTSVVQRFGTEFSKRFRTLDWQMTEPVFDHSLFLGSRLHSLTLDLHGHKAKRQHLIRQFLDKSSDLHKLKIRAGITGVDTRDELDLSMSGKLTYISGNAITGPLSAYAPAQKIDMRDLPILEPTVLETVSIAPDAA